MYNVVKEYVAGKDVVTKQQGGVHTKNKVILDLFQDLQRMLLRKYKGNDQRGRSQIKFGMTSLFNKSGFTLIELLVVVLIIGILAAVAVPQYQKAVLKSRVATHLVLLNSLYAAMESCYLSTGDWNKCSAENLDVTVENIPNLFMTDWDPYIMAGEISNIRYVFIWNDNDPDESGGGVMKTKDGVFCMYAGAGNSAEFIDNCKKLGYTKTCPQSDTTKAMPNVLCQ